MKNLMVVFLIAVVLFAGIFLGFKLAQGQYQSKIIILEGQVAIYKNQAEKYSEVIRTIRETAAQATVTEKAPEAAKAQ